MDVLFVLLINTMAFCHYLMFYTLPLKEKVCYIKPIKCSNWIPYQFSADLSRHEAKICNEFYRSYLNSH